MKNLGASGAIFLHRTNTAHEQASDSRVLNVQMRVMLLLRKCPVLCYCVKLGENVNELLHK